MSLEISKVTVSIIIPFYNVDPKFFERCFTSIKNQSFTDFEVIIIDDGSKYSLAKYIDSLIVDDQRFRVIHQENKGVSYARNIGLKYACGEVICFVDADDYVAKWMLEDLWTIYKNNNVDAVVSYYTKVFDDNFLFTRNSSTLTRICNSELIKDIAIIGMNCDITANGFLSAGPVAVMFNSQLSRNIKFPENISLMEDVIWNCLFFEKCNHIAICEECVYAYRQNESSATHSYKLNVIDQRKNSLLFLKSVSENNKWYALRLFANYTVCCKCIMKTDELSGLRERMKYSNFLYKDKIWDDFKQRGVSKNWSRKMKIKRLLALCHLLPLLYAIH